MLKCRLFLLIVLFLSAGCQPASHDSTQPQPTRSAKEKLPFMEKNIPMH